MSLTVLEVPFVRPGLRAWPKQSERGTYDDEAAALDAVRQLAETTDPDLLVLAFPGHWRSIAEGQRLVTWATVASQPRRRGIPRVRVKGDRFLCGHESCGGELANLVGPGSIRPVAALVRGAERNGLPTVVVRRQARLFQADHGRRRIESPIRGRQRRAMETGPYVDGRDGIITTDSDDDDVILLECPACLRKGEAPRVSLLITRLDTRIDSY